MSVGCEPRSVTWGGVTVTFSSYRQALRWELCFLFLMIGIPFLMVMAGSGDLETWWDFAVFMVVLVFVLVWWRVVVRLATFTNEWYRDIKNEQEGGDNNEVHD